jgi:hypothetical protein
LIAADRICRIQANKRISRHRLLSDHQISGNFRGLLERGVQVNRDREEEHDDTLFLSIGYAGSVGVIALAVSPHSLPFTRLQHAQLHNDPYLYFLKDPLTKSHDKKTNTKHNK